MGMGLVAAFWGVSALFVITPGADWAYAITSGLRNRSPLPAVLGLLAGHALATLVVAGGVGALVSSVPLVLTGLTLAGSLYLVWLGFGLLRNAAAIPASDDSAAMGSRFAQAAKGLGISGLNPKVFLLFLALLPQFTDPLGSLPIAAQMALLGLIHTANCAVVYLAVGYGAQRVLRTRPAAARIITRISGGLMVAIGLVLLADAIR